MSVLEKIATPLYPFCPFATKCRYPSSANSSVGILSTGDLHSCRHNTSGPSSRIRSITRFFRNRTELMFHVARVNVTPRSYLQLIYRHMINATLNAISCYTRRLQSLAPYHHRNKIYAWVHNSHACAVQIQLTLRVVRFHPDHQQQSQRD